MICWLILVLVLSSHCAIYYHNFILIFWWWNYVLVRLCCHFHCFLLFNGKWETFTINYNVAFDLLPKGLKVSYLHLTPKESTPLPNELCLWDRNVFITQPTDMYCLFESLWSVRIVLTRANFKKAVVCFLSYAVKPALFFQMEIFHLYWSFVSVSHLQITATVVLLFELTNRPTLSFAWLLSMWFDIYFMNKIVLTKTPCHAWGDLLKSR